MTNTIQTTQIEARRTLAKAIELRDIAAAEVQRIAAAIRTDSESVGAARTTLENARRRAADVEAQQALGEADAEAVEAARAETSAAEKDLVSAEAAAAGLARLSDGLGRRLEAAQTAEGIAREEVARAENALILAALVDADAAYTKAADELAAHAGRVLGLGAVLHRRNSRMVPMATQTNLGFPSLPTLGPVSAGVVRERSNGRQHGMRAKLIEGHTVMADAGTLEAELLHASVSVPEKARTNK